MALGKSQEDFQALLEIDEDLKDTARLISDTQEVVNDDNPNMTDSPSLKFDDVNVDDLKAADSKSPAADLALTDLQSIKSTERELEADSVNIKFHDI